MLRDDQLAWGLEQLRGEVEVADSIKDLLVWTPMAFPRTDETQDRVLLDALAAYKADLEYEIKLLTNECGGTNAD